MYFDLIPASIEYWIRGLPSKIRLFFPGSPLDPALAVTMAKTDKLFIIIEL
jgi:hypothetical protein